MKNTRGLAFLLLFIFVLTFSACPPGTINGVEPTPLWAKRLGGANNDFTYGVTVDTSGNVIAVGRVNGDADFNGDGDASDGGGESAAGYGGDDAFIVKFNSAGVFQWSKRLGRTGSDYGCGVAADSLDNVFVTGLVEGNADLNGDGDTSDGGGESAAGYGGTDIFIAKFDSAGTYQWSKRLGGSGAALTDSGYSVAVDPDNAVYVTGYVNGDADLNGDADSGDGNGESATGYAGDDIFITKFNSAGAYQWSKRLGGQAQDRGHGITTDDKKNVIVTGHVIGGADLNGDGDSSDGAEETTGYGGGDIFISRFTSSGAWQWCERLGGTDAISPVECGLSIKADTVGNIVIAGMVRGNADLNGDGDSTDVTDGSGDLSGEIASSCYGNADIFVVKFQEMELNDNYVYMWSRRLGGDDNDYGYGIAIDAFNNSVVITGLVSGNADLNGDADSSDGYGESAAGYGDDDVFITKFTSGGTFLWSKRLGGIAAWGDAGKAVAADSGRNNYIAGYVAGGADLNGDIDAADGAAETGAGYGGGDGFIAKFNSDGTAQ